MSKPVGTLRTMGRGDIPRIVAMEQEVFTDPWPASAFTETLSDSSALNYIVTDDSGGICGYLCAQVVADEVQIHNVAVLPSHRQQGVGRRLLECVEREGHKRGAVCAVLEVRINNAPALAMYGRMGYRRIARRRGYYRQPVCDALVLLKVFDEPQANNPSTERCSDGMVS